MTELIAQGLVKEYHRRTVVNGVSLRVAAGEVVGLLGPNGAGKTTCFYMLVGLTGADGGSIHLNGHDLTRLPMHQRARLGLGYLPQEASIFRKLSVADNVMAILETRDDLNPEQRARQMQDLLHELHVGHLANQSGASLSGGERRRVEIARALAAKPLFMLLDEPFAGVDPISVVDIQRIIAHLKDLGLGVLITDHNVRETLKICDRAYIVNEGRIIAQGAPEDVLADEQVRAVYLGQHFHL